MIAIGHATSLFFLIGFIIFLWMIYKKTRKVVKRANKQARKEKSHRLKKPPNPLVMMKRSHEMPRPTGPQSPRIRTQLKGGKIPKNTSCAEVGECK